MIAIAAYTTSTKLILDLSTAVIVLKKLYMMEKM